ncbi:uncharacterized protein LOC115622963 isoform X2 [Scaptodrosophila lebanonensis]|uniref:Uncharacterized protein LOC115622963 isoform X2 n=1 Tax=Drosophila lebanonensis TaxID=7225 RepID=A0A6J2TDA8_DROLE|nr:uncharacterized protein LOC115622963 isoform X2 [Scaptodrosophila lebanonensis]
MQSHDICLLLVTCLAASITESQAIRVDWGTNKGPIVPPTPRTTPAVRPPYREPAPVWEDQSDDIPNPHPYVYVLPPPSRPRTWPIPIGPYDDRDSQQPKRNYGTILAPQQAQSQGYNTGALSAQYVPGVGLKYTAVVGKATSATPTGYYAGITDKLQGKYNAKTKKYKAYEKVKYTPLNYVRSYDSLKRFVRY